MKNKQATNNKKQLKTLWKKKIRIIIPGGTTKNLFCTFCIYKICLSFHGKKKLLQIDICLVFSFIYACRTLIPKSRNSTRGLKKRGGRGMEGGRKSVNKYIDFI